MAKDRLEQLGIDLIPEPQELTPREGAFRPGKALRIVLPDRADPEDRFAADEFAASLKAEQGIEAVVVPQASSGERAIRLGRSGDTGLRPEGYRLTVAPDRIALDGHDAAGLYWGTRTLLQAFRQGPEVPCMAVVDWPDLAYRAIHYDTKHHQGTCDYVQDFIRTLARYKVNLLVWEWEDKFAYRKHPEIGAPGAFTLEEVQQLTRFAAQHHVQIVPLVQGLGHVSYILKHPEYRHLREIPDSNWEFCPLKEESYELLFDLWDEAIEATPGSEFLHIGSDETYELGLGEACGCRAKAEEIGKDGLMQIFIHRCVGHVEQRGRRALSWGGRWKPGSEHVPPNTMGFVDSGDVEYLRAARHAGYAVWVYAPNPGIEPLFLPYLPGVPGRSMWQDEPVRERRGSFRETAETLAAAAREHAVDGSITTSWDDSGLHNQCWMPRFVCAAEFSWKAEGRDVGTWTRRFFANYFGPQARDLRELFQLLQDGALFWHDTFERRVWHYGDVGMVHPPDLPRGDLEFHPFWRRRYAPLLNRAREERLRIARAIEILDDNLALGPRHAHDLDVYRSCAELMRHNADLILLLGELEAAIAAAHGLHYTDRRQALQHLRRAEAMIEEHLRDRAGVFGQLVAKWEETRLPKGLSLPHKPYVHARDRARHFANRTPDMAYLILDEQLLDLEGYLERLKDYTASYEKAVNPGRKET